MYQSEPSVSRHVTRPAGAGMVLRGPFPVRFSSGSRPGWSGGAAGTDPLHKLFSGVQTLGLTKAVLLIAKIIVKREGSLNLKLPTLLGCCGARVGMEFEGQSLLPSLLWSSRGMPAPLGESVISLRCWDLLVPHQCWLKSILSVQGVWQCQVWCSML